MQKSIYKTLCYSDVFDYPLSAEEIFIYLIHPHSTNKQVLFQVLNKLVKKQLLETHNNQKGRGDPKNTWYALPGRSQIFHYRKKRETYSNQKKKKTRKWVGEYLKKIPFIKAVYYTGAIAMQNAKKNDDIDIMVITAANQLWTTRVFTTLLLDTFAIRRKPETKHPGSHNNKLCLNLYLDQNSLQMPKNKQNLFTAHEVAQAKLIWEKDNTHQHFLFQNQWVLKFLPHSPLPQKPPIDEQPKTNTFLKKTIAGFINQNMYKAQKLFMKPKKTHEIVTANSAFFHPRNTSEMVVSAYQNNKRQYLHLLS